jgi:hypothetical protein
LSELNRYRHGFKKLGLQEWHDTLDRAIDDLRTKIGTQAPTFVDSVQPQAPVQPSPARFNVSGLAGVGFTVTIVNPQDIQPASTSLARAKITKGANASLTPIRHNVQSGTDTNFNSSSNLQDYKLSNQTSLSVPGSGVTLYWRLRSSFDGQNWNSWQLFSGPTGPVGVAV